MIIYAPVDALRAHQLTKGRQDVRYYLNALHFKGDEIQTSNGHVALSTRSALTEAPAEGLILNVSTPPTGRAYSTAVIDTEAGIVYWCAQMADKPQDLEGFDFRRQRLAVGTVDIVDARYPDLGRVIESAKNNSKAVTDVKVMAEYLGLVEKLGKKFGIKMPFVDLHFAGKDMPMRVEFKTPFGPSTMIIMPARP